MGRSTNKTRQTLTAVAIQKPVKDWIQLRDWLFVALENGYIVPATSSTPIEWCAVNDVFNNEETKEPEDWSHRACIYFPKRHRETFTIEVENGEIEQSDVGQTFLITGDLQHINYATKDDTGWQFRLERVITPTKWEFTYYFESALSPQWPKWDDGETPTFTFEPVVTLPVGSPASMEYTQDWNEYTIKFKIPAWSPGADWDDWTPGQRWPKWDTIDLEIGTVIEWEQASATITEAWPLLRKLNLVIPRGQDGEDGLSPTPRDTWSASRTYTYLDIVRYNDQDGVGCSWIRKNKNTDSTSADVPWLSSYWTLLVKDWADWEPWPEWGTIVVPVEWRPGRDWLPGSQWEPGVDWKTPHSEWTWISGTYYSPLSMVRADTWETDMRWNPIYWYYVTNNWASGTTPPKDSNLWDLVSKDGMASNWNEWSAMVFLKDDQSESWHFDWDWNGSVEWITWSGYTGNSAMVSDSWTWITITKTGHYRVYWHVIVQNNTGTYKYINLWRASIQMLSSRTGSPVSSFLCTAKQGWPYSTTQWPWLDLSMDCEVDLYAWDVLVMWYRPQTDTTAALWLIYNYKIKWSSDTSGSVSAWALGWRFATYMWASFISKLTPQSSTTDKVAWDI